MCHLIFFIILLSIWRITHLIQAEDGPFDIIFKLRKFVGNGFFGKLMDCFDCVSIWVSIIPAIYFGNNLMCKIILTLSFSGGAILLEKITSKNV